MLELDVGASRSTGEKNIVFRALGNNYELMCINFVIIGLGVKTILD